MDSGRAEGQWPVDTVAVAVVNSKGTVLVSHGPQHRPFPLESTLDG